MPYRMFEKGNERTDAGKHPGKQVKEVSRLEPYALASPFHMMVLLLRRGAPGSRLASPQHPG